MWICCVPFGLIWFLTTPGVFYFPEFLVYLGGQVMFIVLIHLINIYPMVKIIFGYFSGDLK
jgi:hypothetical protein